MPTSGRKWPFQGLRILTPILGILLVAQYLAGLWTSAYAPPNGFTSNTAYTALNAHYAIGMTLGILVILVVIVAAFTRQMRLIGLSVVAAVAVWIAAIAGQSFVGSTPNPPSATILMGIAFLVAFWASAMFGVFLIMGSRWTPPTPANVANAPSG